MLGTIWGSYMVFSADVLYTSLTRYPACLPWQGIQKIFLGLSSLTNTFLFCCLGQFSVYKIYQQLFPASCL